MATKTHVFLALKPGTTTVYLRNQGGQTFRINHPDGQLDVTTVLERAVTIGKVQTHTVGRKTNEVTITAPAGAQFLIVWDNGQLSVNGQTQPSALQITNQPQSISTSGTNTTPFQIGVSGGTTPYAYQWQYAGNTSNYQNIGGATASSHVPTQAGNYRCIVNDNAGQQVTSNNTTLVIITQAPPKEAYWGVYDAPGHPATEAEIFQLGNYGFSTDGQQVKADWRAFVNQPKYCTVAYLNYVPGHWAEDNNPINNGSIGTGETFKIIATIPAVQGGPNSGPGGSWTVVQSEPTDFANLVSFTQ